MKKVSPEDFLDCVHGRKHPDDCEEVASSCNNELVIKPEELIGDWVDKKCPKCGSQMLGNKKQDEWCSFVDCDYGCEDFNKHLAL